jgi:hypothetical protein
MLGLSSADLAGSLSRTGPVGLHRTYYNWSDAGEGKAITADHASGRLPWVSFKPPGGVGSWAAIGAGSYRLSAHALAFPERIGPLLSGTLPAADDANTSSVFGHKVAYQQLDASKHKGMHSALTVRAEMCAACHDVTNALPIKNPLGRWVGGFPIERTYTEWLSSRYADRPGNANFDPRFKRDCQSCHMQQDYGQPGTAQTLYRDGHPLPTQFVTVRCCGRCNRYWSLHEGYCRSIFGMIANPDAHPITTNMIEGSVMNHFRKDNAFRRSVMETIRMVPQIAPNGFITCSACAEIAFKASTTLPLAVRSTTRG